jgi:diguanylate cyclase (GGDEF)-like protein
MMASIYGSLSIYVGGVLNTILVAVVLAYRVGAPLFYVWAAFEIVMAGLRMAVLVRCRRAVRARSDAPVDLYILLSLLWGAGIGFGSYVAVSSGDWIAALIACVSSAAMLGGLSFRYFAAPRLACAMLAVASVPGAVACLMSGEPTLLIVAVQIPLYVFAMTRASFWMNRIMVKALCAERENAHRARHDVLTDLLNRRGLEEAFAALPPDEPVACFFMDLDGFKQVNDTLGHAAGDELLAMVAQRLRAAAAPDDIVARIGGDEFLMIARRGDAEGALIRGEGLISALAGLPYLIGAQGALIGVSVGAALRPTHGTALERLLAAADEALYEAKSGQRNRCVVAGKKPAPAEAFIPDLRLAIGAPY